MARFLIQSHRGAGHLAPENTLGAFEQAWALRTCPEADLRTTRDGVIVAAHDADLTRVLPPGDPLRERAVRDLAWAELSAAAGAAVPGLAEILALLRGRQERRLYLDIKEVDLEQLAASVRDAGAEEQVILASPRHEQVRQWKTLCPAGETLLWMGGEEPALRARLDDVRATDFAGITQLQIHVRLHGSPADADPFLPSARFLSELARELRPRGILFQTLPWNVGDPEVYRRLLDLGVASFATDYPEVVRPLVDEYLSRRGR